MNMEVLREKLNLVREIFGKYFILTIYLIENTFITFFKRKKMKFQNKKKNILVIGILSANKGGQARAFTVIDRIKRRFSNKNIYVFYNSDYDGVIKNENIYNFKIIAWCSYLKIRMSSNWLKYLKHNIKYLNLEYKVKKIIKNTAFIIDAYGHRVSSQMSSENWISFLQDVMIASRYSVPYIILPQSIGPFDFPIIEKMFFYSLIKKYYLYPKKILIREKDGLRYINQFRKENVDFAYDIVLNKNDYKISNIFKENPNNLKFIVKSNSICIIPNIEISKRVKTNELNSLYNLLIKDLVSSKKIVYILSHSSEDLGMCIKIKNQFLKNNKVILITDDLNVFEIEHIIKQMDFIIASRYHSIVHAYKNSVPVLAIGWSIKYLELLDAFNQSDYYFDIRSKINIENFSQKLQEMKENYTREKKKISQAFDNILLQKDWLTLLSFGSN